MVATLSLELRGSGDAVARVLPGGKQILALRSWNVSPFPAAAPGAKRQSLALGDQMEQDRAEQP